MKVVFSVVYVCVCVCVSAIALESFEISYNFLWEQDMVKTLD